MSQHLTGRTFSGIFQEPIKIKASLTPKHIIITHAGGILTVEDQMIESGSFDTAKSQAWPITREGK